MYFLDIILFVLFDLFYYKSRRMCYNYDGKQ